MRMYVLPYACSDQATEEHVRRSRALLRKEASQRQVVSEESIEDALFATGAAPPSAPGAGSAAPPPPRPPPAHTHHAPQAAVASSNANVFASSVLNSGASVIRSRGTLLVGASMAAPPHPGPDAGGGHRSPTQVGCQFLVNAVFVLE